MIEGKGEFPMEQDIKRSLLNISNFIKPGYQVSLVVITMSLLFFLTYLRMHKFHNIDPRPQVSTLGKTLSQDLSIIDTGFYIRNFLDFDMLKNDFLVDGYLWFEFDKSKVSQEAIDDFSFGKAEIVKKSKPYMSESGDRLFVGYDVKVRFPSNLNYKYFPLDDHSLYLTLNNLSLSIDKAHFHVADSAFRVSPFLYTAGWKNVGKQVTSGLKTLVLDATRKISFPRVLFSIDFMSTSMKRFLLIFLPLFVIFFLSLFTLSLDPTRYYAVILSVLAAMMTALLTYRFVIESMSPKVPYFMLSDRIFNFFLYLSFAIFLINSVFLQRFARYRGAFVVLFHGILIVGWVYFLYF